MSQDCLCRTGTATATEDAFHSACKQRGQRHDNEPNTHHFACCCVLPCKRLQSLAGVRERAQQRPHRVRPPALQLPAPQAHSQRLTGLKQQQHTAVAHPRRCTRQGCVCGTALLRGEAGVRSTRNEGRQLRVRHARLQALPARHNSTVRTCTHMHTCSRHSIETSKPLRCRPVMPYYSHRSQGQSTVLNSRQHRRGLQVLLQKAPKNR